MKTAFAARKAARKEKRKEKKQKKENYYKKLYLKPEVSPEPISETRKKTIKKNIKKVDLKQGNEQKLSKQIKKTQPNKAKKSEKTLPTQTLNTLDEDDLLIRKYEKKLGISKDSKKEDKFQKEMIRDGLDRDFFGLLDKIHASTKNPLDKYRAPEKMEEELSNDDEFNEENSEINEEFDDENEEEFDENDEEFEEDIEINDENMEGNDENMEEYDDNSEENDEETNENDEELNENEGYDEEEEIDEGIMDNEDMKEIDEEEMESASEKEQVEIKHRTPIIATKPILKSKAKEKPQVIPQKSTQSEDKINRKAQIINQEATTEISKKLQSNLNKLAEGNIDNIFSQTLEIFNTHSKFVINELFTNLFLKNLIENAKILPHILACTCCFTSGLHQVFDNAFFSELMRKISEIFYKKLPKLIETPFDEASLAILKNISLVLCHFYLFNSLPLDFLKEFIEILISKMSSETIEILLLVIQNIGLKVRKDNPKTLKELIDLIKEAFERFKNEKKGESQKGEFLMSILQDIRLNKNIKNNPFETLGFLMTWLKKNVIGKLKLVEKVFSFSLKTMEFADFTKAKWWSLVQNASFPTKEEDDSELSHLFSNERKDYLEKLASEQKFLTTLRKKIFMVVMSSEDYAEAFQNLLKLKLNRKQNQDLAVVLVECCAQESTFNKFYVFLIEKLVEARKELRFSIQYAFWDQFKLLENFTLRKICNLAKLMASLILKKALGLGSLKGLELDEKNDHVLLFLKAFCRCLAEPEVAKKELGEMVEKVKRNEENLSFCEALYEYLKRKVYGQMKEGEAKEKIKSFLGFLKVEL